MSIPRIPVAALFAGPSPARDAVDALIHAAATDSGFMTLSDLPADIAPTTEVRRELFRLFTLPDAEKRKLLRRS